LTWAFLIHPKIRNTASQISAHGNCMNKPFFSPSRNMLNGLFPLLLLWTCYYAIAEFCFDCLLQVHCFDVDKLNRMYEGRYKHDFMAANWCPSLGIKFFLKVRTRNKIGELHVYTP
jgi:hypothetical protein